MASLKSYAAKEGLIAGSRVGRFPWLWWGAGTLAVTIITFGASLAMMSLDESRRESLLAETGTHSPSINWRDILKADPDLLLVVPCGYKINQTLKEMESLTNKPGWNSLAA